MIIPLPFWVFAWDLCNKRHINKRKATKAYWHLYIGDTQRKMSNSPRLEFRLKYHLCRVRKGVYKLLEENKWFLRKMNEHLGTRWVIRVCDKVSLGVILTSSLLISCDRVNLHSLMKLPERDFVTIVFLLEDLSLGRWGELRGSFSLFFLFFKCLHIKVINIPKHHVLG